MALFLGTLLIVSLCGLLMGIGLLLHGKPLTGGCSGGGSAVARCAGCPHRESSEQVEQGEPAECPNRGEH
jgi:hypothetical protein